MAKYTISQLVLNWYHEYGRKHLPWQKNQTLYTVWISEVMLQQTQVESAIPFFKKFILRFPNLQALQKATLDDILYLWSGLGYYHRAKNIHKAVQIIYEKHHGKFPDQFLDIIQLPGIGKSTAGAILSLSLNYFYSILDGNVKRILVRYYGIISPLKNRITEKKLWNLIESITPIHNTRQFNQAMMDIGALICTIKMTKCYICPLKQTCIAYKKNILKQCSLQSIKTIKPKKISWFIIIKFYNHIWMIKNTKKNLWKNLFCFPQFDNENTALEWLKEKKIHSNKIKKLISFIHKFSHYILHIYPILVEIPDFLPFYDQNNNSIWYNLKKPQHVGLPQPVKKIFTLF
ncbi:A/G-specific adenine glycosylase [Buchnera aphidicola (Hyadaphis tataricae)]|uniref:Adenine DNA glycosylase n=1 Tax=Buchnera aphidicola (Hyadaphis tataricae) TaxID=1241859 RepID=A0A4D6YBF7_9GAMM|nr:A/G-specific adenine glycosylase [Buchnera aphidicola]QCI21825.1 A/G-specific adenine glycosylase [Buchnera aphidicola (Hyadaphis tataricae)]